MTKKKPHEEVRWDLTRGCYVLVRNGVVVSVLREVTPPAPETGR